MVRELALPEGVVIAMMTRGDQIIPPHGNTRIEAGDHVILVLRPETRPAVNNVFGQRSVEHEAMPEELEFPLRADVTVGELESFYGIGLNAPPQTSLGELLHTHLSEKQPTVGASIICGQLRLSVRGLTSEGGIERVGMQILPASHSDA